MNKKMSLISQFENWLFKITWDKQIAFLLEGITILIHYKRFIDTLNLLKKSQYWSKNQIEEFQFKKLKELLTHSYKNVPYYKKIFDDNRIKPEDIKNLNDFQKIPFLTKEIIKIKLNEIKAKNYPDYKFGYITTGGSTGTPVGIYEEKNVSNVLDIAFYKFFYSWIGGKLSDKFVYIRGNVIYGSEKGKFWKYFYFHRGLSLSSYHMTDENLKLYVKKIRKFRPKYIVAYPSSLYILAKYMKKNKIKPFSTLKFILCGAENLYDWQKDFFKEIFKCNIYESYGHTERAVIAFTCEKSGNFHISPIYGYTELIGKDGKLVTKENEVGEIVTTGLLNFLWPLIRYKTGDMGVLTTKKCECGRNFFTLKKIEGRSNQDFVITKNKRLISMTAMNMHSNVFDNVAQFQFYQDKIGVVEFHLVKMKSYTDKDTQYIRQELLKKLGSDVDLKIKFLKDIPKTPRGKQKFLEQKLPINLEK